MSSDIFVGLVPAADLTSRLTELAGEVDAYLRSDGIRLCAGIRYFSPQERTSPMSPVTRPRQPAVSFGPASADRTDAERGGDSA